MNQDEEGWHYPYAAPAIPEPPYEMLPETEYLFVFFDAERSALEHEVPHPLELAPENESPLATMWVGDAVQPPHSRSPYHEGVVGVRVTYEGRTGWYFPYMWTDNDEAMLTGHLYGFPKQLCDTDPLETAGNTIRGVVNRCGKTLFEVNFSFRSPPESRRSPDLEAKLANIMAGTSEKHHTDLQVRKIPSPEPDGKVLKQVIEVETEDYTTEEIWEGNASLEIRPNGYYPNFENLTPTNIHSAFYLRPNFILPEAEVVWEEFKRPSERSKER
jgi:acetoacetate decarboxylase